MEGVENFGFKLQVLYYLSLLRLTALFQIVDTHDIPVVIFIIYDSSVEKCLHLEDV